jgi:hypothetical protein
MQKHSFSVVVRHTHPMAPSLHSRPSLESQPGTSPGQGGFPQTDGYWAKAGVLMLVRMGADQATAAPAPSLFSILLREILPMSNGSASPLPYLAVTTNTPSS